jgi:hypothetical protein
MPPHCCQCWARAVLVGVDAELELVFEAEVLLGRTVVVRVVLVGLTVVEVVVLETLLVEDEVVVDGLAVVLLPPPPDTAPEA